MTAGYLAVSLDEVSMSEKSNIADELDWPEELEEKHPQYSRLSDALDEVKESVTAIIEDGLMTEELRQDLFKLAKSVIAKLEEPEW